MTTAIGNIPLRPPIGQLQFYSGDLRREAPIDSDRDTTLCLATFIAYWHRRPLYGVIGVDQLIQSLLQDKVRGQIQGFRQSPLLVWVVASYPIK